MFDLDIRKINELDFGEYLKEEEYIHSNNSQICVITKYDEIFIQKNR